MYRVVKLAGKYYANNIDTSLNFSVDEAETTVDMIQTYSFVYLAEDLEYFAGVIGINAKDIEIVN